MIHILMAAYNEELALGDVLAGIAGTLGESSYKVWVVDDGSTDATSGVAEHWRNEMPLVLIRHDKNQGLGAALHTGFSMLIPLLSSEDVAVTLDADNTHSPSQILTLTRPILEGRADLVVASRFVRGAESVGVPLYRRILSGGAAQLFKWFLPIRGLRDYTCGFRAYRGSLLKEGQDKWGRLATENGFAAAAEIVVKLGALKPRVLEAPLSLRYDQKPGVSKMRVGQTIFRNLAVLFRLRKLLRP
jgi:dolichol-phosphate mannosyltransferase